MTVTNTVRTLLKRASQLTSRSQPPTPPSPNALIRGAFRHYLAGNGIEIGALNMPLDLSGLPVTGIRYVDRLPEDELSRRYPELGGLNLTHVDIIDDGEILSSVHDESLDFVIGNHFIEHARNPMGTIVNLLSKLKPGGLVYMAVPDKRFTFDAARELTPLDHLIEDYQCHPAARLVRDRQHFVEWATYVDKLPADEIAPRVAFLIEIDYSIHFHTFSLQGFLAMLDYLRQEVNAPQALKACADVVQGSKEFLVVLTRV
jgi:SAM-dependent methyltransferase